MNKWQAGLSKLLSFREKLGRVMTSDITVLIPFRVLSLGINANQEPPRPHPKNHCTLCTLCESETALKMHEFLQHQKRPILLSSPINDSIHDLVALHTDDSFAYSNMIFSLIP